MQEIDLDVGQGSVERSFSDSGYAGYQMFAGISRRISNNWSVGGELRYGSITGVRLEEETGNSRVVDLEYDPLTVQLGLKYTF